MKRTRPSPAAGLRAWQLAFASPPPDKEKAVRPWQGEAAHKTNSQANHTPTRHHRQRGRIEVDALLLAHAVAIATVMALLAAGVLS